MKEWSIDCGDYCITFREVISSIVIVAIMMIIGFRISNYIANAIESKNLQYEQAIHITEPEIFQHCADTQVGDVWAQGLVTSDNPVTYDGIDGAYMYIRRDEEHYRKHERTYTDDDGKKHTETYWSWDTYDTDCKNTDTVHFLGVTFNYEKLGVQLVGWHARHIKTDEFEYHKRYVYYAFQSEVNITTFCNLTDHTCEFYDIYMNKDIDQAMEEAIHSAFGALLGFWSLWFILISFMIYGYYYLDNTWLEDRRKK